MGGNLHPIVDTVYHAYSNDENHLQSRSSSRCGGLSQVPSDSSISNDLWVSCQSASSAPVLLPVWVSSSIRASYELLGGGIQRIYHVWWVGSNGCIMYGGWDPSGESDNSKSEQVNHCMDQGHWLHLLHLLHCLRCLHCLHCLRLLHLLRLLRLEPTYSTVYIATFAILATLATLEAHSLYCIHLLQLLQLLRLEPTHQNALASLRE
jgi:hypothetical protein